MRIERIIKRSLMNVPMDAKVFNLVILMIFRPTYGKIVKVRILSAKSAENEVCFSMIGVEILKRNLTRRSRKYKRKNRISLHG